jgi:dolichol-phosphate mannosyltransferase
MILGQGVIARRFMDYGLNKQVTLFAGDVHDSKSTNESDFKKEEEALKLAVRESQEIPFVFFGSCSILDPASSQTPYSLHKKNLEEWIAANAKNYLIVRLPQLLGLNDEPTSLVSHLISNIYSGHPFEVWAKACRNFIDVDDVYRIVHYLLGQKTPLNRTLNVASPFNTKVPTAVSELETFLNKKGNYKLVDTGSEFQMDVAEVSEIAKLLNIDFGNQYFIRAVTKYWRHLIAPPLLMSVVVPTYNEEHGIDEFYRRTKVVLDSLSPRFDYEMIFVNDFSTDKTFEKLKVIAGIDTRVKLINFSKNFGNQIGITAVIDHSKGDVVVVIDDDLQDPPEIILNFLALWSVGYKVVNGVRPKRHGVNFFFKIIAKLYYRLIASLSDTVIQSDTGDFRLIDRMVVDKLNLMREENRYYRGMVAWVGYAQTNWLYERDRRYAGTSTFSLWKYVEFAFNGITSFTDKPLYLSSVAGGVITMFGFFFAIAQIIHKMLNPEVSIRGWTSLSTIIIFFGGVQLLSIGVLGIYISKIYREVKARPLYLIESTKNLEK